MSWTVKEKNSKVLRDEEWKYELMFLVDIIARLSVLNIQLQGRDRMICEMYDASKSFQVKLRLWGGATTQMWQLNLFHFACYQVMLSQVSATVFPKQHLVDKLSEFTRNYSDSKAQNKSFRTASQSTYHQCGNCTGTGSNGTDRTGV